MMRSVLRQEGLGHVVGVVQVWARHALDIVLWNIVEVSVLHPHEVWVPWQVVLGNPSASTLGTTSIEVARHRIGILKTLTLLGGLHPFWSVTLGLDADAASILEDDHGGDCPEGKKWCADPHRELLKPRPIWWVVLSEITVVHGVEDTCWKECPVFPFIAVIPDRLVERILLGRSIWLKLWWGCWRHVQEWRRATKACS